MKIFRFGYTHEGGIQFPIGSHVSLKAVKNGQPVFRNYTPVGPYAEVTREDQQEKRYFDILIKLYDEGQMSQCLKDLTVGDKSLHFSAPTGNFDYSRQILSLQRQSSGEGVTTRIGMIAAGTGITPMMGVAEGFMKDPEQRGHITLLFANQKEQDILFREAMSAWEAEAGEKTFKVIHTLTHPPANWGQQTGFLLLLLPTLLPCIDLVSLFLRPCDQGHD